MKTLVIWILTGALVGIVAASVIAPPALSWYSAPGGLPEGAQIQAIVEIPEVIRYATGKLMRAQLFGAAIGAGLGAIAAFMTTRKGTMPAAGSPDTSGTTTVAL
jgi:hypothetical protein